MSLNIGGDIITMASEVKVTIDTNKFGPRQITALHRMVRSGMCEGSSVPSRVAQALRKRHGAPFLAVARYVEWHGVSANNNEFFDKMAAAVVADKLLSAEKQPEASWRGDIRSRLDTALSQHQSEGAFYFYGKDFPKTLRSIVKGFNFEIEVPETPRYVEIVVWDGYTQVLI